MATASSEGRPVHLILPTEESDDEGPSLRFNSGILQEMKDLERLQNSKVAVISVAGAFRKGKSFLLNFLLRYLRALSRGDVTNWLHSEDSLSDGFHWRSGSERDTTGILIWSEPFFIKNPNGEEVAVLLMDTQGTFDHQSTQQDCTTIFAFSTLLSSVQIFNISQNIQETDLQYLRLFVEFAAMAKNSKDKVLQHLWFLVRDWQYPDECEYGKNGGAVYLNKVLACDSRKSRENQELRRGIQQHFEQASCCLLPYPGSAVSDSKFRGEIDRLDDKFVLALERFISDVAAPENITVKKVNGNDLTGSELISFLEVYFQAFSNGKMPSPRSIFNATVEMTNLLASAEAKQFFEGRAKELLDTSMSDGEFAEKLALLGTDALDIFTSRCMEIESTGTISALTRLEEDLKELQHTQSSLRQLRSENVSTLEQTELVMAENDKLRASDEEKLQKIQQMEAEFKKCVEEIRASSVSKDEMKRLLQNATDQQADRLADIRERNYSLESKVSFLTKTVEQQHREHQREQQSLFSSESRRSQSLEAEKTRLQKELEERQRIGGLEMNRLLDELRQERGASQQRIREVEERMNRSGCCVM